MRALCFGSLNIDYTYAVPHFVAKGETLASTALQVFSGGKGLNQAVALARAGMPTCSAGAVGPEGDFLVKQLAENGINTERVFRLTETKTGHAIIQNDPTGDNCILLFGGANQAITPEMAEAALQDFGPGDLLLLQNEISSTGYIMEAAARKGMRIVLNPSPMDASILDLPLDLVNLLILNEVEAAQLTGLPPEAAEKPDALCEALTARFPDTTVVLTLGASGSVFMEQNTVIRQEAFDARAVDTTAAGDTFTGFLLAGLYGPSPCETPKDAMALAAKAAAISVTRMGASPSIPTMEEVLNYK